MSEKIVTWQEFEKHTFTYDCWIMVEGRVYNMNDYLVQHPGGDDILVKHSGIDATEVFNNQKHTEYAISLRDARFVGKIESPQPPRGYLQRLAQRKKQSRKIKTVSKRTDKIPRKEVALHKSQQSCWVILNGKVLDVTDYLQKHPGGINKIMGQAGKDASKAFKDANHSNEALKISDKYVIGQVQSQNSPLLFVVIAIIAIVAAYFVFFR